MLRLTYAFEDVVSRLAICVIALCVFASVISRYFFNTAIAFTEELSGIAMVWAVYLGACIAVRKHFHIRILFIIRMMPRHLALACVVIGDILFLLFCAMMLWIGFEYISLLWRREFVSPSLGIDQKWPQSILLIGYALMTIHTIGNYWRWHAGGRSGLPGIDEVEGQTANLTQAPERPNLDRGSDRQ